MKTRVVINSNTESSSDFYKQTGFIDGYVIKGTGVICAIIVLDKSGNLVSMPIELLTVLRETEYGPIGMG
jgi:hypothetical protein